jgi:hypothetical protein
MSKIPLAAATSYPAAVDAYSIPARICLAVAIFGATLLAAVMLRSTFVM